MSRLDNAIHQIYQDLQSEQGIIFNPIKGVDTFYEAYYAEERLYLLREKIDGAMYIVKGSSPKNALDNLIKQKNDSFVNLIIGDKKCSKCGRDITHHKLMVFLKNGAYLGTSEPDDMPKEFYEKREFDFGFDYCTTCRLAKKECECGNYWYEKVED